jgi:hypothetical protein
MDEFYLYLPHPSWWLSLPKRPAKYRTLRLKLRVGVYLEAVKTISSCIAKNRDVEAHARCALLLQQAMRHISYYFMLDDPHAPEKWNALHEAMRIEAAWCSDAVIDWIWQQSVSPNPEDAAVADTAKHLLQRIAGKKDILEQWESVRKEYEGRDAIVTIDELMTLTTNIPPRTIELHCDTTGNHVEQDTEHVDSVQYLYRCMTPGYLRFAADRIAHETIAAYGGTERGMKTMVAASIIYAERVARLSSIRRSWLPKALQPLYSPATLNKTRQTLRQSGVIPTNMVIATAVLASVVRSF